MTHAPWIFLDGRFFPGLDKSPASAFCSAEDVKPVMAVFRRVLKLEFLPEELTVFASGDCKYRLFINGDFVDDGPTEVGGDYGMTQSPDWFFFDRFDVRQYCRKGENVFVLEVFNVPDNQCGYSVGRPGVCLELYSDDDLILRTDESWSSTLEPGFVNARTFHADCSLGDYHRADFDAAAWCPARKLTAGECRWNLIESEVPRLQDEPVVPERFAKFKLASGASCVLSFPREVAAHLEFELASASAGTRLQFEFMEIPNLVHDRAFYRCRAGRQKFRFIRMAAFQQIRIAVLEGEAAFTSVTAHSRHFPVGKTALFQCSDRNLTRLRNCVDQTMKLCMMRMHWDSPVHQEGLGCIGDYLIESRISGALYGDWRLTRADLRRTMRRLKQADGVLFHTSYSLLYPDWLHAYFYATGDVDTLRECFPGAELILARFRRYLGREGLVSDAPNYMFIDWMTDGAVDFHHPPASRGMGAMTAFAAAALKQTAELALHLDQDGLSERYMHGFNELKAAFNRELFVPEKGLYKDGIAGITRVASGGWLPADDDGVHFSTQTNALALWSGLAEENAGPSIMENIMHNPKLMGFQPYFAYFVLGAMLRTGTFGKYAFELFSRYNKLVDEHPTGLKECFNQGDYSHAWGGAPAYYFVSGVMGITPLEPGWTAIRVAPETGSLGKLKAEVFTPRGRIKFDLRDGRLRLELPRNMKCLIASELDIELKQ